MNASAHDTASRKLNEREELRGQADVGVTRRAFLKAAVVTGLLAGAVPGLAAESEGGMPYRRLGRTGEKVSAIGLGMKSMGSGVILRSKTAQPIECLHYALNLPTSVVITGIDRMEILDQALEAARTFKPMSQEALSALLARTAEAAGAGQYEPFKTTTGFDGTAHNPQWPG